MPAKIDHDRIALLICIEEMENVKRVGLEPFHFEVLAIHHADARAVLRLPLQRVLPSATFSKRNTEGHTKKIA